MCLLSAGVKNEFVAPESTKTFTGFPLNLSMSIGNFLCQIKCVCFLRFRYCILTLSKLCISAKRVFLVISRKLYACVCVTHAIHLWLHLPIQLRSSIRSSSSATRHPITPLITLLHWAVFSAVVHVPSSSVGNVWPSVQFAHTGSTRPHHLVPPPC